MSKGPYAWKRRPRSPGLQWYKNYNSLDSLIGGRILVIDYIKQGTLLCPWAENRPGNVHRASPKVILIVPDYSREGMRKVAAQEINSIDGLRKLYANVRSFLSCMLDHGLTYV